MNMNKVTFILHKPQLSENIGACARAIKNFNFQKLYLIEPKPIFPNDKILATSVGAKDIIKKSKVFTNLESSLGDIDILIATSARFRNKNIKHISLNELTISEVVGKGATIGAFVNFGADWHGPGQVLFGNRGAVVVGEIDGTIGGRTEEMHQLLQVFEPDAVLTDNIWGYLWGKLAYGAMLFATAINNDSMADNFANPSRSELWVAIGREVMGLATKRGIQPVGFNGFNPMAYLPGASDLEAQASIEEMAEFNRGSAKTHSGIWRDLAVRKRKTEVTEQLGVLVKLANEVEYDVPLITTIIDLIHDIEDGVRDMSDETFAVLLNRCQ